MEQNSTRQAVSTRNGAVAIIALILVLILAWNYIKLLFEAAERYILLGVLVYTAPAAFSMGASHLQEQIHNIFRIEGEKDKEEGTDGQLNGIFRFGKGSGNRKCLRLVPVCHCLFKGIPEN